MTDLTLHQLAVEIAIKSYWEPWRGAFPNLRGRWVDSVVKCPVARVRFRNHPIMGYGLAFLHRIDGDGWMIDIFKLRVRQTRGNRDRMMEDLIALRMSM